MNDIDRRRFLKIAGGGTVASLLSACGNSSTGLASEPIPLAQGTPATPAVPPLPAPATPGAATATGTIMDVEHIVVLMQENRSFDHYFGTLRGVRGFGDPRPWTLPSGKSAFHQSQGLAAGQPEFLPFHPADEGLGMKFLEDLPHGWGDTHGVWNNGAYDGWIPNKTYVSMVYFDRQDIPFHYALADAYTICDGYHCSLLGPTDPNRYHMFTGWVGNDGKGDGPVITNAEAGYGWTTYPERLEAAGVSWKIYQDMGDGLDAAGNWGYASNDYTGNYGDNSLLYFNTYRNALPGDPLFEKARTGTNVKAGGGFFDILKKDVTDATLPKISWIVAPYAYSEHGNYPANYGARYVSQMLEALMSNPAVWSKTALFITYDENDGLFDHAVPAYPAASATQGASTVDVSLDQYAGDSSNAAGPYGLGVRVPMLVISPWSKGGWVCSENFDHTSIIRFMETRFGVQEPNITPWHRAVCGDLTSAFDFTKVDASIPTLPDTAAYEPPSQTMDAPYVPPPQPLATLPPQEAGSRPARALPYRLTTACSLERQGNVELEFVNLGAAGAVFLVSSTVTAGGPWSYTVEAGKSLIGQWATAGVTSYQLRVHGPAGTLSEFAGLTRPAAANPEVRAEADGSGNLVIKLINGGTAVSKLTLAEAYGKSTETIAVSPGAEVVRTLDLVASNRWFDVTVTADTDRNFLRRFAGHVENGQTSISDPAIITT